MQQKDINLVRLRLQIITLSDMISQDDGFNACVHHINGQRRPNQTIRQKNLATPRCRYSTSDQTLETKHLSRFPTLQQ
jgi:hypothetical protein